MHTRTYYDAIYKKAMTDIAKFTENDIYDSIKETQAIGACESLAREGITGEYTGHPKEIIKTMIEKL